MMCDLSQLKKEVDTNNWYCQAQDGVELIVCGSETSPDESALEDAKLIIEQYELIKNLAIQFLESFMKDKGEWFINTIKVTSSSLHRHSDFIVELGFESESNKYEYSYTGFTVHFVLNKNNPTQLNKPHPFKFSVEFS